MTQSYWNERAILLNESLLDMGDAFYMELADAYELAVSRIEKEISDFYRRFAADNKMTYAQAKRLLTSDERRRFQLELYDYIEKANKWELNPEWADILENASTVARVTRLEYLNIQMRQQLEELHVHYDTGLRDTARDVFTEGYYRSLYDAELAAGHSLPFAKLDTETLKTVVNNPWSPDGSNFSEKIWKDRTGLVSYLHTELTQAFIRGESADRLIKDIKQRFGVSSRNAARLVQTETAFFSAMSKLQSYKTLGYRKYIIVSVIDGKTSAICREMNNEVFDIDDFKPGVTANPFHPRCRSTTAPFMEKGDEAPGPGRVRDPFTGKLVEIPRDMSFREWYDLRVESEAQHG